MGTYIPHTKDEREAMLKELGLESLKDLYKHIPEDVRLERELAIPAGKSEYEVESDLKALAGKNRVGDVSYLGAGMYDHIVPAAIAPIINHPAFVTAYTPYQGEISQGLLQAIFEFQSFVCQLTGLDVSNASLYDGATAIAEAVIMAVETNRKGSTLLVAPTVHPASLELLNTYFGDVLNIELLPFADENKETTDFSVLQDRGGNPDVVGLVVQSPNFFGVMEELAGVADAIHAGKGLFIMSVHPTSLAIAKTPAEWGADIAVGDGQPLGLMPQYGGPSVGFIAAREKLLRKLPGRIVGQTVDHDGKRAFVLTLQAREQHIKRARASSNICSNQALSALAVSVYLSLVGPKGLKDAALACLSNTDYLITKLRELEGVEIARHAEPRFNEFVLRLPVNAIMLSEKMQDYGILAGLSLKYFDAARDRELLVAVTEKRTRAELDAYVAALKEVLDALR